MDRKREEERKQRSVRDWIRRFSSLSVAGGKLEDETEPEGESVGMFCLIGRFVVGGTVTTGILTTTGGVGGTRAVEIADKRFRQ